MRDMVVKKCEMLNSYNIYAQWYVLVGFNSTIEEDIERVNITVIGPAPKNPSKSKEVQLNEITETHANEIELGFWAHIGHMITHSWKEAFKGKIKKEDPFIKKAWEVIKGFGSFFRNLFVEAKGFIKRYINQTAPSKSKPKMGAGIGRTI